MEPGLPKAWADLTRTGELARTVVHVVDDDRILRAALLRNLTQFECEIEGHESAESFLERYRPEQPHGLVLDLRLPGMSGLELLSRLHDARATLPTIVLSSNDDVESVVRSIQRGAIDFLRKPPVPESFARNIRGLLEQAPRMAVERRIAAQVAACHARLTPREREVYVHLMEGSTPKQVAAALGLRPRTAHIHCSNVLAKFHADSPNDLLLLRARLASGPFGLDAALPD